MGGQWPQLQWNEVSLAPSQDRAGHRVGCGIEQNQTSDSMEYPQSIQSCIVGKQSLTLTILRTVSNMWNHAYYFSSADTYVRTSSP